MIGAATALLVLGFYFLCYRPQIAKQDELAFRIGQIDTELAATKGQTDVLDAVREDVERLKVRLNKVKTLPNQSEFAQFIRDVGMLGTQASLKRLAYTFSQDKPERTDKLNEIPIKFTFEGDFVDIFSFLRHTEELQRLTRIPALTLKSQDKTGQVKAELTMNIYYLAE